MQLCNFIDPTAVVPVTTRVWHYATILANVIIGENSSVGSHTEIGRGSYIGHGTRISAHVFLPSFSRIGDNVFIGPGTIFTDDRHPRAGNTSYHAEPPRIEDHASIGAGCVILPGVRIGAHAIVGAGSTVTKDVPSHGKIYGPAAARPAPRTVDLSLFQPVLGDESNLDVNNLPQR